MKKHHYEVLRCAPRIRGAQRQPAGGRRHAPRIACPANSLPREWLAPRMRGGAGRGIRGAAAILILLTMAQGLFNPQEGWTAESLDRLGESLIKLEDKKININVSNVDIQTIIRAFANQTGVNIIIGEGVEGKISLVLKNADPLEALTSILGSKGYSWYAQDEHTLVATPQKESQTFHLQYTDAADVAESLTKLIGAEGTLALHKPSNAVMVHGNSSVIRKARNAIKKMDTKPRQVLVEARIIQLDVGNVSNLGIIAGYTLGKVALKTEGFASATPTDGGLVTSFINNSINLNAVLNMLEKREDFNLKSSPRIVATENKKAELLVGERIGYKVTTTTSGGLSTESVQFLDVGTRLIFTAKVSFGGDITLEIHPEISKLKSLVDGIPNTTTSEATTLITVKDGQSIVIGGLIEEQQTETNNGVPLLKDIPIVGIAFRSKKENLQKKELLVFMTPHLVNDEIEKEISQEEKSKEDYLKQNRKSPYHIVL